MLEPIWTGAKDGPNRGLLCVIADTVKPAPRLRTPEAPPESRAHDQTLNRVYNAVSVNWETPAAIAHRVGYSERTVREVLQELQRDGMVIALGFAQPYRGRPQKLWKQAVG
jgi:biotin operon repressor